MMKIPRFDVHNEAGEWKWSHDHAQFCRVIETQTLWGETVCRVWLPGPDVVVRIPASRLQSLESAGSLSPAEITYIAAAARVADALTQDVLLAPLASTVIPLPHQLLALSRAIAGERIRYLLADEVGLGKTIEAGLIMRELKLRGLVRRTLVVAPKGLVTQWVAEMRLHFGETFQLVLPDDLKTLQRLAPARGSEARRVRQDEARQESRNPWTLLPQVVVPMDAVKPLEKRRGWTAAQVEEYNRERFEDLLWAGWDLIIVDEAHRLGGSTDQVARFKLGQGLAEAAPYLLLLSATPHQGKTDAFHRLVSLLDAQAFPDSSSVTRERIQPYVIRTEKRRAIDAEGKPLFKPRRTELTPISWQERHRPQQLLYEAVTAYVREGYNQALREKRNYIGFLMLLMQRLVVSSTRAIRVTLEKRLEALSAPQTQLSLFPTNVEEEWADLDGQEQLETLLRSPIKALKNERAEVKMLLEAATRCEQVGPDAKAEALLAWLYRLQAEEGDPDLKVIVFTEFVPTQEMLRQFLTERGFTVVCLNGSMDQEERQRVQAAFAGEARILISTDAGGEGLNLQFCHVVINYDIPWNPMRLEQRIGRVDRIGQKQTVRALNFVFENSVEHRVREVLEEKLNVIFQEFGCDKTSDVLDSAQAGKIFDDLYMEALLNPEQVETSVENVVRTLREQAQAAQTTVASLTSTMDLHPEEAQRLLNHPLPHWLERMTISYLEAHGGKAEKEGRTWKLTWPDGEVEKGVVFTSKEAEENPTLRHLTLEEPKVRGLVMRLPRFVPGQPLPVVAIPGIAAEIHGYWSLWQISISGYLGNEVQLNSLTLEAGGEARRRRVLPLFLADNGKVFTPTARHIWDQLLTTTPVVKAFLDAETTKDVLRKLQKAAEEQGIAIYRELVQERQAQLERERERTEYALAARRKAIERIGLPQVRHYRLNLLAKEEREWRQQFAQRAQVYPELTPLLAVRVEGGDEAELA